MVYQKSLLDHDDHEDHDIHDTDVFGDEFEIDDWDMGVADGFRPSQNPDDSHTNSRTNHHTRHDEHETEETHDTLETHTSQPQQTIHSSTTHIHDPQTIRHSLETQNHKPPHTQHAPEPHLLDMPPITSVSAHFADSRKDAPRSSVSRNSIRKDRSGMMANPFMSPQERYGHGEPESLLSFEPDPEHLLRRTASTASSLRQFAPTNAPPLSSGPSHPYTMYPQGTLGRPMSMASSSAGPSIARQGGPQHPYTMYPQGVMDDDLDEHDDHIATNPVPLGFLGLGQTFHRQVGPDGEEQDIIGGFGHTEQLPPYSRYPEDAPEKMPMLVPEAPRALHSRDPVAGSDPTMALMLTPLHPESPREPQSMSDASTLVRSSSRSSRHSRHSRHSVASSSMSSGMSRSWSEKNWSQRRKTRFCGVPFWIWMCLLLVIIFIGSVLGGIVGGFVEGSRKHRPPVDHGPATSLYDASAIATPTNSPPPTGTWKLQLSTPTEIKQGCLVNPLQGAAWNCYLAGQSAAAITVGNAPGTNKTGAYLYYASNDTQMYYGAQAAYLQTNFASFLTVIDNDNPGNGPAYYFQQFYDKLVVVPEFLMSVATSSTGKSTGKIKRDLVLDPSWFVQRTAVRPGQKPWFCVWNQTFVEGFIYVQQNIVVNSGFSSTSTGVSSTTAVSSSALTQPPTSTMAMSAIVSSYSPVATSWSSSMPSGQQKQYPREAIGQQFHESEGQFNKRDMTWDDLPMFPHPVKIEERRLPGNPYQPYCQQYQILDNNQYNFIVDGSGNPIIVNLNEQDPTYTAYQINKGLTGNAKRGESSNACHCQWVSGQ